MSTWFYVDSSQNRQGPATADALVEAFRLGQVGNDSLVWREGLAEWSPLRSFRDELGLADVSPVAVSLPPVAPAAVEPLAKKNNGCLIAAAVVVGGGIFLLFILAILAAIALPAYQDYVTRSKVAAIHAEGKSATAAVEAFKANTDRCPRDAEELGLTSPTTLGLEALAVGSLDDGKCAVEVTLGAAAHAVVDGGRLLWTLEEDGRWTCTAEAVPEKYLPTSCR